MVFEIGGKCPCSCCFVVCCFQDLFNLTRSIFVQSSSSFFFTRFVNFCTSWTLNTKSLFQVKQAYLASSSQKVQDVLSISQSSVVHQIQRVALGKYQASFTSHCPMMFISFIASANPACSTRRVSGELAIS